MSNLIKSCSEILSEFRENDSLTLQLNDVEKYLAHTSTNKASEKLESHLKLVEHYFANLVSIHRLDTIIDSLIGQYLGQFKFENIEITRFIKKIFVYTICYHDHGKINDNFQASPAKMANPLFQELKDSYDNLGTQHSRLSAYIFIVHSIKQADKIFKDDELDISYLVIFLFSFIILKHHNKYLDDDLLTYLAINGSKFKSLLPFLEKFKESYNYKEISDDISDLNYLLLGIDQYRRYGTSFHLYQLLRLNFSLLTASDYLATNEYMNGTPITDFGVLSRTRIDEIFEKITTHDWQDEACKKINFNKKTYLELETLTLEKPKEKSNKNLNLLRQQMAAEAIRNLRLNYTEKLFYIEAPTGGGKTNISMLVALELLKLNPELKKVFYVFPFTTLIDQTYNSIKQNLGLSEKEIVALHSKASFMSDGEKDDVYGQKRKNYLNHLFLNYPFCLLSHIRFFEVLKTNEKEQNYILHRLANCVVVIDELQTYSPEHWDKVIYLIQNYAKIYNIRFVLMSATLPKLHKLDVGVDTANFVYLLPNAREDYFQNTNFKDRVRFNFELAEKKIELTELAEKVLTESKLHAELDYGLTKPKDSVYAIVEFIFKKSATIFFNDIQKVNNGFFEEVFVLSGTILEHRRKHIINFLKHPENRKKKILLITTQVVEAGVDIDMDLGFKDKSLLDSDEQLAGRINRNMNKQHCQLFLFNYNQEAIIHGNDYRLQVARKLSSLEQKHILESKNFDLLYDKVIEFKNNLNLDEFRKGFQDYLLYIKKLKFTSVSKEFKLIDQENLSCFIPMKIPVTVDSEEIGKTEEIFTSNDLRFLSSFGIFPNSENRVCGQKVYTLYLDLVESKKDFLEKKIEQKQMQSILSKYVFSLFANDKVKKQIVHFSNMEKSIYGYYYVDGWKDFYDEVSGMSDKKFYDIETQFL